MSKDNFSPLAMMIKRARVVSPLPNGERERERERIAPCP
jgi:hypothetical protein